MNICQKKFRKLYQICFAPLEWRDVVVSRAGEGSESELLEQRVIGPLKSLLLLEFILYCRMYPEIGKQVLDQKLRECQLCI